MDIDNPAMSLAIVARFEMSANQRLELRGRPGNVISLGVDRSDRGYPGEPPAGGAERGVFDAAVDFYREIAAVPWRDGILMVGG
jgi:hypothetical protein